MCGLFISNVGKAPSSTPWISSEALSRSNMTPEEYMVGTQQCVPATNQHLDGLDDWIFSMFFQIPRIHGIYHGNYRDSLAGT